MSPGFLRKISSRVSFVLILSLVLQPYAVHGAQMDGPPVRSNSVAATNQVADIALQQGGVLQGQVVTDTGAGEANVVVKLTSDRKARQTKTDSRGWFRITELRGGTYQFQVGGQTQLIRAWAAGTAPPKASQGILVTPTTDVFRGQHTVGPNVNQFFRVLKQRLSDPVIASAAVLTAVAIPVAIHNADDDDDPPATP